ncbi:GL11572 [Drosophila persimilis]|uniref:GL11572 n=1 Tax=Drosophila persimilis TaxID=7234 RepID=B4GBQ6_DROPE|nr:GL11572 [Drosophila persimilis]
MFALNSISSTVSPWGLDPQHEMPFHSDECIFQRSMPSVVNFVLYGLVVPTLSIFGLCTNFINAVVFMRPKMTPSAFTYLAALSWMDCVSCLLITLTALSRSYFYYSPAWITYDYRWQTPLFGISTGAANLILACLSLDRFTYLASFRRNSGPPKFCRRKVARYMIAVVIAVSVIANIPYFFVFYVDQDGTCHVQEFYYSTFYKVHNWFSFTLLALLPAVFLLIGNTAIIIAFRRVLSLPQGHLRCVHGYLLLPCHWRSWRRCRTRRQQQPTAEECVVSSVAPHHLPADEAMQCGCASWASDSDCQNDAHCRTAVGTFTLVKDSQEEQHSHSHGHPEPEVFTTRSSSCLHAKDSATNDDSIFSSSFIIIT